MQHCHRAKTSSKAWNTCPATGRGVNLIPAQGEMLVAQLNSFKTTSKLLAQHLCIFIPEYNQKIDKMNF
jgi:hypothetical protein